MTGWWVVIGTLGGVVITAVFSLVTTYLNHRWAVELFDAQQRAATGTVLRTLRREVYLRYLVAVQSFYDKTDKLYSAGSIVRNPSSPANSSRSSLKSYSPSAPLTRRRGWMRCS
jgi:hypothetical protein